MVKRLEDEEKVTSEPGLTYISDLTNPASSVAEQCQTIDNQSDQVKQYQ